MQIVALIVEVLATLHENVPSLGSQIKGKVLAKTIRTRRKDRLIRSGKEGSISPHLPSFPRVHQ
jgi:hypothetical protein